MISVVVISKHEPALDQTLGGVCSQARQLGEPWEVVVVDASAGGLEHVRRAHSEVRWIDFEPAPGVRVSIPHQRNHGVREAHGEIVVFTDAGCIPQPGWLRTLVSPLLADGEQVAAGISAAPPGQEGLYDSRIRTAAAAPYVSECPTINIAFRREAFQAVDGFDERFEYGSDIDFSWRLVDAGLRIRSAPDAVVRHDWGDSRRQLRRAYLYGRARARLYGKHRGRLLRSWRSDPMILVYPAFLLGLPITLLFPLYPALLLIPAWRNRDEGALRVLADHLAFGVGVLSVVVGR